MLNIGTWVSLCYSVRLSLGLVLAYTYILYKLGNYSSTVEGPKKSLGFNQINELAG